MSGKEKMAAFILFEYAKPITIKDNCWLASNVVVCGGVTIGEGCVIGAGSVVTRDIPPYSLAAGNPCRVIRKITEKIICKIELINFHQFIAIESLIFGKKNYIFNRFFQSTVL